MPSKKAKPSRHAGSKPRYDKVRLPELDTGTVVWNTDSLIIRAHYEIDYIHSYAEDTPFFLGLSQGKLKGSRCTRCRHAFATPGAYCMQCGAQTKWIELPLQGRVHTWTICHCGGEEFLKETPVNLVLVEFEGIDPLLLSRLVGATQEQIHVGMGIAAPFRRNSQFKPTNVYLVPAEPPARTRKTAV